MDGQVLNGENVAGLSGPPTQHIALHLLSKVLDDETIFNLEEGNTPFVESLLPLTVDPSMRCVIPNSPNLCSIFLVFQIAAKLNSY